MNLKQLETFIWIARLGSFAAASQRLNTTQSAISTRIQDLEYRLGAQLFVRGRRAASLTAKGQELLALAETLMDQVWEIQTKIGQPDSVSGIIRLGASDLIAITWLGDLVREIYAKYPNIKLALHIGLAKELVEMLRSGELDMALSPGKIWTSEFESIHLGEAEFLWMVSKDFQISTGTLTPKDLRKWPIVTLSTQSYHHRLVNRWFREGRANSQQYIECNSIAVISALTESGLGVGLLPTLFVKDKIASGELRVLDCEPQFLPVDMYAFMPRENVHPLAVEIANMAQVVCTLKAESFFQDVESIALQTE